ncbi:unannotated protein [freshwater metagenome]|uniref:Unannotated protein n=1 Tax=freshwater metagenome TaxID=449393 RepID=A0A6J7IFN0_9ZZZZ
MEYNDPECLSECGPQIIVDVDRIIPALSSPKKWCDHVGFDRAGPEERDVDNDVVERIWSEFADEFTLTR